jgi:CrcB protein
MSAESLNFFTKVGLVAAGGSVGTLLRFGVYEIVVPRAPSSVYATFAVNVLGCLVFGALRGAVDVADWGSFEVRTFVFFGVLGAFTTFSTFEADMYGLLTTGQRMGMLGYLVASIVTGFLAFAAAYALSSRLLA